MFSAGNLQKTLDKTIAVFQTTLILHFNLFKRQKLGKY